MIKVSDYIFERLATHYGVRDVFMITGGGAMHLNDAICKTKGLNYICNHHEQGSAIAAEGYSRSSGRLGVVNVTTGPGGLNTMTGVMGQWTDSVPVLYISGQVKFETTIGCCPEIPLRQLGDQEVDIIRCVKPLTKYAVQITKADDIKYELDKAIYIAEHGRKGPVWIDVPMNIQGALIDPSNLREFTPDKSDSKSLDLSELFALLDHAERPLFVAGHGIKIAKAKTQFLTLLEKLKIPTVTTFNGMDILADRNPYYAGRIGTLGNRSGNFALQNADLVITIGSRNNIRQTSYNYEYFARGGKLVVVDIDPAEMQKPTIKVDVAIEADAATFIAKMDDYKPKKSYSEWLEWCVDKKTRYSSVLPEYAELNDGVHPYYFVDRLTKKLSESAITIAGNGSACVVAFQAAEVKQNQQYIWNSGCASMGYDLPAAIGAAVANPDKQIICLAGDGSLMMNLQELAVMAHNRLPIKLIILNNGGYISIKQTQDNFFDSRYIGCGDSSGVSFPDFMQIAKAFGIKSIKIENNQQIAEKIEDLLMCDKPIICEVNLIKNYIFAPKTSSVKLPDGRMVSKPLEDLYPFLPREEFEKNMIIKPLKQE